MPGTVFRWRRREIICLCLYVDLYAGSERMEKRRKREKAEGNRHTVSSGENETERFLLLLLAEITLPMNLSTLLYIYNTFYNFNTRENYKMLPLRKVTISTVKLHKVASAVPWRHIPQGHGSLLDRNLVKSRTEIRQIRHASSSSQEQRSPPLRESTGQHAWLVT